MRHLAEKQQSSEMYKEKTTSEKSCNAISLKTITQKYFYEGSKFTLFLLIAFHHKPNEYIIYTYIHLIIYRRMQS